MAKVKKTAKKITKAKLKTKASPKPSQKPKSQKIVPEFLVVSVPENIKEGSNMKLLHVADSLDKASDFIGKLAGSGSHYFSILEKKSVLKRAPIMKTSVAGRNIITR